MKEVNEVDDVASSPFALVIRPEDPGQPDIRRLLQNGEINSAKLYPAESIHHAPVDALRDPESVRFLVGRDQTGQALATGALLLQEGWAEIKRIWVEERARQRGIGAKMLEALEREAGTLGIPVLRLETGVSSQPALKLYERAGFRRIGPFGAYRSDPLSVFMEKTL